MPNDRTYDHYDPGATIEADTIARVVVFLRTVADRTERLAGDEIVPATRGSIVGIRLAADAVERGEWRNP